MAEPLSIASGVTQLIVVAFKGVLDLCNYIEDLQIAQEQIKHTLSSLKTTRSEIHRIGTIIQESPRLGNLDGYEEDHPLQPPLQAFNASCEELRRTLRPYHNGLGIPKTRLGVRIRWRYYRRRIEDHTRNLVHHRQELSIVFSSLMYSTVCAMDQRDQWRDKKIERILSLVEARKTDPLSEAEESEVQEVQEILRRHMQYNGPYGEKSELVTPPTSMPAFSSASRTPVPMDRYGNIAAIFDHPAELGAEVPATTLRQMPSLSPWRLGDLEGQDENARGDGIDSSRGRVGRGKGDHSEAPADWELRQAQAQRYSTHERHDGLSARDIPALQSVRSYPSIQSDGLGAEDHGRHSRTVRQRQDYQHRATGDRRAAAGAAGVRDGIARLTAPMDPDKRSQEGYWIRDQSGRQTWRPHREPRPLVDVKSAPSVLEMSESVVEETRGMSEMERQSYVKGWQRGSNSLAANLMFQQTTTADATRIPLERPRRGAEPDADVRVRGRTYRERDSDRAAKIKVHRDSAQAPAQTSPEQGEKRIPPPRSNAVAPKERSTNQRVVPGEPKHLMSDSDNERKPTAKRTSTVDEHPSRFSSTLMPGDTQHPPEAARRHRSESVRASAKMQSPDDSRRRRTSSLQPPMLSARLSTSEALRHQDIWDGSRDVRRAAGR